VCRSAGERDVDPEAEHEQAERNQEAAEEYARGFAGGIGCRVGEAQGTVATSVASALAAAIDSIITATTCGGGCRAERRLCQILSFKDAIGIYDPTGATNPSAQTVIGDLGKPNNYIGANSSPDVHNANLGTMTAADLNSFVSAVTSVATNGYGSNPGSINLGTAANPAINVVNGDFSMGPSTGYGILVVTGTLTFSGNYSWNGLILVIGTGASVMNGGGNGQIVGALFVANTAVGTINSPSASCNGGGGNGVQYDHCWADDMLARVPYTPIMSPNGLQVVSLRTLVY
jgi:hypothetical protein